jgi:adenosylcobinamide-GDP ribazoletransferase
LGAMYSQSVTARSAMVAILAGSLIAAGLLGFWALPSAAVVALVAAGMGLLSLRKIAGITGDVLGATQQLTEIGVLLVCVAAGPGIPWWRG